MPNKGRRHKKNEYIFKKNFAVNLSKKKEKSGNKRSTSDLSFFNGIETSVAVRKFQEKHFPSPLKMPFLTQNVYCAMLLSTALQI